jgi:cell division protein FtsB
MTTETRLWIIVIVVTGVVASFLFSSGLRNTISRRHSIRQLKSEIASVSQEIELVREEIRQLKDNPQAYEILIRRELGYLKPGEKEIRFSNQ